MATHFITRSLESVALIGNYLPRLCGIASFTHDLCEALTQIMAGAGKVDVLAMNDLAEGYAYPDRVKFQLAANKAADYARAALFLNVNQYDVVIVQHEYGIFGGKDGEYIIDLVSALHMPVITTLHTVLLNPSEHQKKILVDLAKLSEQLVVMSHKAKILLHDVYGIPLTKVSYIPHGIPQVPFSDPDLNKGLFDMKGRKVILTFGLLGPNKGIEAMVDAMVAVAQRHPDALYVILGATHPAIIRNSGEAYRHALYERVSRLSMGQNVIFHDLFVKPDVLQQYLSCADLYVTPYPCVEQITSGTLAYALGAGKAIVSTPYWHAEELLAEGCGQLVGFEDVPALSAAICHLLANDHDRDAMRKLAYQASRHMVWAEVAHSYLDLATVCLKRHVIEPKPRPAEKPAAPIREPLPAVCLEHLRVLTDDTGILQHATFATPNRDHGYCVDDNARALLVVCRIFEQSRDRSLLRLIQTYLSFLSFGFNPATGRFRNFMSYGRVWQEEAGSEDAHGRALWALGQAAKCSIHDSIRERSVHLFDQALAAVETFTSPRAKAFSILGIQAILDVVGGAAQAVRMRHLLAESLLEAFKRNALAEWCWLEETLAYVNAKIPQALIAAGQGIPNAEMLEMGLQSLQWLIETQTAPEGHLSLVGNDGWYPRGGVKAKFDQQPIEAMCLVEACAEAFRATGQEVWRHYARRCFAWFLGRNDLDVTMCDFKIGGCFDGLMAQGPNRNMGAESTLAWLIALLTKHDLTAANIHVAKDKPLV